MKQKPILTFLLILLIVIVAAIFSLPSPNINIHIGPLRITRDLDTKLGLDLKGGSHLVFEADTKDISKGDWDSALEGVKKVIERRVNLFGLSESVVQSAKVGESNRVIVELPGIEDVSRALALIGKTAQLDFREEAELPPQASASAEVNPYTLFAKKTDLTGKFLKKSTVVFNQNTGEPQVSLEFNSEGATMFEDITKRNIGKRLAIFLDDLILSAPVVNEAISGGTAVISGSFTVDQAKELSKQLNGGALPVPVAVIEQSNIGPSLGEESIRKSITAGLIGLGLVVFFMIGNYGRLGIIANFALITYGLISLALFKLIPITLTLPGIAGFILSIGMAVDSNILIFERIKEEKRAGRTGNIGVELGFGKAWDSIRDANITTLLTCFILFNPFDWSFLITSGLVRGFATTLALGIFISLFTGIIVTRTLVRLFYK